MIIRYIIVFILCIQTCYAFNTNCTIVSEKFAISQFFSECVNSEKSSLDVISILRWARALDKNPDGFEKLLKKLEPRLKRADFFFAQYLYYSAMQDKRQVAFLKKAAQAGSIEGAYYLFLKERKFSFLLKAYLAGYPPAIFDYALAVNSGNYGLKKDPVKAATLVHQAALKGDSAAIPSLPQYFSLLPPDDVEFWKAMTYLQLIPDASADTVNVTHWPAFCKNFAQAGALFWALPESVDMTRQQQEFLVQVAINCSP